MTYGLLSILPFGNSKDILINVNCVAINKRYFNKLSKKIIFKIIQTVTAISSTARVAKTKTYWNKTKNSFNKTTKNK